MYIFELITKYIKGKKYKYTSNYSPANKQDIIENPQECEHFFQPLDSTNRYFACKFCGMVIEKDNIK